MGEPKYFRIVNLNSEDKEEVVQFVRKYFYKDEPIDSTLGITDCIDEETWLCGGLADGCSFKAVNDVGEIVAIKLNGITHRKNTMFELKTDHTLFDIVAKFLNHVALGYNVFKEVPGCGDLIVEGKVMVVRDDFRNRGVASALYRRTTDWMKENGIKHMITVCSSHFSALACMKLGFVEVYSINYADYVVDGVCPILPKFPHITLRTFLTSV